VVLSGDHRIDPQERHVRANEEPEGALEWHQSVEHDPDHSERGERRSEQLGRVVTTETFEAATRLVIAHRNATDNGGRIARRLDPGVEDGHISTP
jgi:hypothetical protein